jgi:SAM-dependent methyltransferase
VILAVATRARSFDAWAVEYDRYRPTYPAALFDEIACRLELPAVPRVADIGAGTGLATLAMARRGWETIAVEPGAPMLAVLHERAAAEELEVATVEASAEATSLPDASIDLSTAAQAFHWFDHVRAVREMARIVRPGGGIALFWNARDAERSPFLWEYSRVLDEHGGHGEGARPGRHPDTSRWIADAGGFAPSEFFQVRHSVSMTSDEFLGLVFTASYVRMQAAARQGRIRRAVEDLLARHAPAGVVEVPYVVDCEIARREDR